MYVLCMYVCMHVCVYYVGIMYVCACMYVCIAACMFMDYLTILFEAAVLCTFEK